MARSNQSFELRMSISGMTSCRNNPHGEVRVYRPENGAEVLVKTISQEKVKNMDSVTSPVYGDAIHGEAYWCVDCGAEGTRKIDRQVRCVPCQEERIRARARSNSRKYQAAERKRLKYAREKAIKKENSLKKGE